ncbi:acyl carrier protein [Kordiimonas aestuarii]|uniref:acyl carrier protein n=1 Tax=Kordiimonas aestuarii TaxID=1005925 RepID=UPI0021CE2660|nr:acyl carrier protein [Kordiimonas aestuarii]
MRKGKLKDIAASLVEQFVSRNNDVGGYWALGCLYKQAKKDGKQLVSIDLSRGEVDFASNKFDSIAQMFRTRLKRHARLRGVSYEEFGSAVITVSFNDDQGAQKFRSGCGDPFVCEVSLTDIAGKSVSQSRTGYCRPHNPKREMRAVANELETIGLGGDGDDVEILEDIEKAFRIKISDEDAAACCTVGDLYELLLTKYDLVATERTDYLCASHRAFNEVRRVIGMLSPVDVKPGMRLSDFGLPSHGAVRAALQRELPVTIPAFAMTRAAVLIWLSGFFASIVMIAALGLPWLWVIFSVIWFVMAPRYLPVRYEGTVGELAKQIAGLNYGYYLDYGARADAGAVWDGLTAICMEHCGPTLKRIAPTTLLLA